MIETFINASETLPHNSARLRYSAEDFVGSFLENAQTCDGN